ncbi:AAA family ATPase [Candidatus Cardinium hertigii]|uniref:AAA family ATPase n=2 Tax=Candidatus Cardinium TaxID=273135 RepID=UPI001FAA5EB8|nr:AAA family ATPase [Candidatus Cardinium hertigii]
MRKIDALPIGYSDVKSVIETGYYVDKTKYAQELIEKRNPIFIARPRRFGKSLFIDTLETICKGEKEVFKDYHIGKSENRYQWKKYSILKIDFSGINHNPNCLENSLKDELTRIAHSYSVTIKAKDIQSGLKNLVEELSNLSNGYESNIVVLIDEYDAPIVNLTKGSDLEQTNIKAMKDFFMTLKSLNKCFQFTFITGVSKFSLSDVFSGANHLDDITISKDTNAIFGYTQEEILSTFEVYLENIALEWSKNNDKKITKEVIMEHMAIHYNGYRFHKDGISVYNPWSTLKFLKSGELENYWYESGDPTMLINQMLADPDRFELDALPIDAYRHQLMYTGSRNEISLKALMFQTGYLTIDSYESSTGVYKLKFPNKEVEKAFTQTIQDALERRVKDYFLSTQDQIKSALQAKDIESFIITINIAFASIPYYITSKTEKDYHSNLHMLLYGLNCLDGINSHVASESPSSKGMADIVLTIGSIVYIIEIKYKANGKVALQQIKENRYYTSYLWKAKEIILLGLNFDQETKSIDSWASETVNREELSKQMNT